jgi:hypothetical protein
VVEKVFYILEWPHHWAVLIPNDIFGVGWEVLPSLSRKLRIYIFGDEGSRRTKVGGRIRK